LLIPYEKTTGTGIKPLDPTLEKSGDTGPETLERYLDANNRVINKRYDSREASDFADELQTVRYKEAMKKNELFPAKI